MSGNVQKRRVIVDSHRCKACGECISACPKEALRIVGFGFWLIEHRHVVLASPTQCVGCGACVKRCPEGALS